MAAAIPEHLCLRPQLQLLRLEREVAVSKRETDLRAEQLHGLERELHQKERQLMNLIKETELKNTELDNRIHQVENRELQVCRC